ncbi:MAG: DUF1573 domain-containing protein [Planctomycetota bacterium]|nr:MAG: DUF1573 domain-containing protein [Planctomycetota bacterium]
MAVDVHGEHSCSPDGQRRRAFGVSIVLFMVLAGGAAAAALVLGHAGRNPGRLAGNAELSAADQDSTFVRVRGLTDDGAVDLGAQPKGLTKDYTIRVSNPSRSAPIRIDRITSSCGCTAARGAPMTLEPGEAADIPVTIALPSNQSDWGVSIALHLDSGTRQAIPIRFSLPSPFPGRVTRAPTGQPTRIPVDALYQTLLDDVEVFPLGSTDPIPSRISPGGDAIEIGEIPSTTRALEIVVTTNGGSGAPSRFTERVSIHSEH